MGVHMNQPNIDRQLMLAGRRWAERIGYAVTNRAKEILTEHGHVDEGNLRDSIEHTVTEVTARGAAVVIGSALHYAAYFHTGTGVHGPHGTPIVPTTRKVLKFQTRGAKKGSLPKERGAWVFARSVQGMEADPFLSDALEDVIGTNGTIRRRAE